MNKELSEQIEKYEGFRNRIKALNYVGNIIYWDASTVAPRDSYMERGERMSVIYKEHYDIRMSKEYIETVEYLSNHKEELDSDFNHEIELIVEDIENTKKIPVEEMLAYEKIVNEAIVKWEEAKNKDDLSIFLPSLKEIVKYKRKEIKYLEKENLKGYDVLLNNYEKGYTIKEYDKFFDRLKEELVPFVKKVLAINNNKYPFSEKAFNIKKQKEMQKYIANVMCFDFNRGAMGETEHPFTWNTSSKNVRTTNHFYLNHFDYSIFSAIHELGHATYELNVDPKYDDTFIGGGASMALHESQSRFYENIIGRSYEFWKNHYFKLQELFYEELKDVSLDEFYHFINNVQASFIRTEADELTYPLHIMLRYELEKKLMAGEIEVDMIEKEWNKLFKEYFGLDVPSPKYGVLQDSHWSDGSFGYFPTYALGSAIASQLFDKMNEDFDVLKSLDSKTTLSINEWLKEHIHKYGSSKYSKEILEKAIQGPFDAKHYINYLINKYSKIYNVSK